MQKMFQTAIGSRVGALVDAPQMASPYNDSYLYLKALVRGEITEEPSDLSALENNVTVCQILSAAIKSAKTGMAVKIK